MAKKPSAAVRIQPLITPDLYQKLKVLSRTLDTSISHLVHVLLQISLEQEPDLYVLSVRCGDNRNQAHGFAEQ